MPVTGGEQKVLDLLEALGIEYARIEHPPVFTVDQARKQRGDLGGVHCKNLFLRNKKGDRHYLVILEESKSADLKSLGGILGGDRLSFASPQRLLRYLGLEPGAVSPFGLINDSGRQVRVLIDGDLREANRICFHPNVNTSTLCVAYSGFERFLHHCGQEVRTISV
jgi:Ala-tRNA(Pro) deacylase